jgi:transcriptional regulator with XRE-family HTH domain
MDSVEAVTSELGNRLRQRRVETGRTLADVAGGSDVSVSYLAAIEAGRNVPSLNVLSRVAHDLGLSLNELLRGSDRREMAFGALDVTRTGVSTLSHPDLRMEVRSVVADPGQRGGSPFEAAGNALVVHVVAGSFAVTLNGDRHELLEGDSLHGTRADELAWEAGGSARSVSVWVTVPTQATDDI